MQPFPLQFHRSLVRCLLFLSPPLPFLIPGPLPPLPQSATIRPLPWSPSPPLLPLSATTLPPFWSPSASSVGPTLPPPWSSSSSSVRHYPSSFLLPGPPLFFLSPPNSSSPLVPLCFLSPLLPFLLPGPPLLPQSAPTLPLPGLPPPSRPYNGITARVRIINS